MDKATNFNSTSEGRLMGPQSSSLEAVSSFGPLMERAALVLSLQVSTKISLSKDRHVSRALFTPSHTPLMLSAAPGEGLGRGESEVAN